MYDSSIAEIAELVRKSQSPPLIITVGNDHRRDDGVGPYIASKLKALSKLQVVDAGSTPENIVDEVIQLKPSMIFVVDAADFGGKPGEFREIPEDKIPETSLSTHMIPMNVISGLIADAIQPKISFIGIQPATVEFGEGLSDDVRSAADFFVEELTQ